MDATTGTALRAARERAGWTREVLAARSGVSRAAIEQIEVGRRADVRISTARRLADALGIPIDDLARPDRAASLGATHTALLYSAFPELARAVGHMTGSALEAAGAALVVAPQRTLNALRTSGLLDDERVDVGVAEHWAITAAAASRNFLDYAQRKHAAGYQRIWLFGVPLTTWAPQELNAWMRFESLVNVMFATLPVTITCAYPLGELGQSALRAVCETHPSVGGATAAVRHHTYVAPQEFLLRP